MDFLASDFRKSGCVAKNVGANASLSFGQGAFPEFGTDVPWALGSFF